MEDSSFSGVQATSPPPNPSLLGIFSALSSRYVSVSKVSSLVPLSLVIVIGCVFSTQPKAVHDIRLDWVVAIVDPASVIVDCRSYFCWLGFRPSQNI